MKGERYLLKLGANAEHKVVEVRIALEETPGVQRILRSTDGKTLSFSTPSKGDQAPSGGQ